MLGAKRNQCSKGGILLVHPRLRGEGHWTTFVSRDYVSDEGVINFMMSNAASNALGAASYLGLRGRLRSRSIPMATHSGSW
jgi:hypothetical protein